MTTANPPHIQAIDALSVGLRHFNALTPDLKAHVRAWVSDAHRVELVDVRDVCAEADAADRALLDHYSESIPQAVSVDDSPRPAAA